MNQLTRLQTQTLCCLAVAGVLYCTQLVAQQNTKTEQSYQQILQYLSNQLGLTFKGGPFKHGDKTSVVSTSVYDQNTSDLNNTGAANDLTDNEQLNRHFVLNHTFEHSDRTSQSSLMPGISRVITTLDKASVNNAEVKSFLDSYGEKDPFKFTTDINDDGSTRTSGIFTDIDYQGEELRTTTKTANAIIETATSGAASVRALLPQISLVDSEGLQVVINGIEGRAEQSNPRQWISNGSQYLYVESASSSTKADGDIFSANNMKFEGSLDITSDVPTVESILELPKVESDYPLNSLTQVMSLRGFNAEGLKKLNPMFAESDKLQVIQDLLDNSSSYITEILMVPGIVLDQALAFSNDGGVGKADFNIAFHGDGSANGRSNIFSLGDLLNAMSINIDFDADASAIMMTPLRDILLKPQIARFIDTADNKFRSKIMLENGNITINGNTTALENVFGFFLKFPVTFLH